MFMASDHQIHLRRVRDGPPVQPHVGGRHGRDAVYQRHRRHGTGPAGAKGEAGVGQGEVPEHEHQAGAAAVTIEAVPERAAVAIEATLGLTVAAVEAALGLAAAAAVEAALGFRTSASKACWCCSCVLCASIRK